MSQVGSVTEWIARLKAGDKDASQELWQRYVERLVRLARVKLGRTSRRVRDEEDVVISVFDGLFRGIEAGRFPQLDDRDDLWQVLVMLTTRRAIDHRRRELAADAGGGNVRGDSIFAGPQAGDSSQHGFSQVIDGEPTPEFAAQSAEELERLLGLLQDDTLRRIAIGKLEGHTNPEIAANLGVSLRTVERKLELIRCTWEAE
jgi:DNA-directed RNA polymerase specialized sigma24 family protein